MSDSNDLAGRHIVLGLSGGIACYKAAAGNDEQEIKIRDLPSPQLPEK